jgi:micrococcal nuclease
MITRKLYLVCALFLILSFSSCSWFINTEAGASGKTGTELDAFPKSILETHVYKEYKCILSSVSPETGFVTEVIDGDSIKAKIGDEVYEIRYIGINTPEFYSSEKAEAELATLENRKLVEGKKVYLFKDKSNTDKYHRLLRYVFTNEYFVNFEMVSRGLAESKPYYPDTSCQFIFNQAAQ